MTDRTPTPEPVAPVSDMRERFQDRVGKWMVACFTPEIIADRLERADRFIEESLELVQATGYSADRAHSLVDYVFNRPVGDPFQEVGGVRVTLSALCNPQGIDEDAAAETELARVWTKIEKIRAKQASKPVGSALPMPASIHTPEPPVSDMVERVAKALAANDCVSVEDDWALFINKARAIIPVVVASIRTPEAAQVEMRSVLSDCAEFLSDIDGALALRCEAALQTLARSA